MDSQPFYSPWANTDMLVQVPCQIWRNTSSLTGFCREAVLQQGRGLARMPREPSVDQGQGCTADGRRCALLRRWRRADCPRAASAPSHHTARRWPWWRNWPSSRAVWMTWSRSPSTNTRHPFHSPCFSSSPLFVTLHLPHTPPLFAKGLREVTMPLQRMDVEDICVPSHVGVHAGA